ncbi:PTS trehalose transporter subunit IIBC [Fusobacterium perfoetens]|uniref:PTS trehalose transporter subunit IIBC n=1 Tax=Fusobacterium perfoetens TaxID=852 RepID=UPI000488D722|nr:PTS trehalose transporter subunit IIBC [Fusobacterium perfoetens]MCI6152224.1 PTS trehalose transporter subunit IIBC [Fusobacterium perfoetens]MDY3237707.1 PTS trehalose transporter subunit IIBC [Fusobacterium perfoetens]
MAEINEKFREDALKVIEGVGGKENVSSVTHCMTRLRFVLKDPKKANVKELENIKSVKGTFTNGGQFQIIIGNNVASFYKTMTGLFDIKEVSKEENKEYAKKNMNPLERFLSTMAEIFVPLLPALICGGLILGFRNIIGDIQFNGKTIAQTSDFWATAYNFLWLIGEAIFHYLPVGITWSVVRKMGGSQILGIVLGITLVSPQLMNAYNIGKMTPEVWDFGIVSISKVGYQAQVIPAILAGLTLGTIETKLNKIVHESVRVVIVPIISLIVTVFLAHAIIGPFGRLAGDYVGHIFQVLLTGKFAVFGSIIFGLVYAPLVITGIHHTTNAVEFTLVQQIGGTMIFPLLALSNISQATASLTMALVSKTVKKDVAIPASISAYLGVTEPALYGVNVKYKYPMICAMIGSGCGAGICGFFGVMANSIGVGGLPGILTVKPQYWLVYLIAMIVTMSVTFILTALYTKKVEK